MDRMKSRRLVSSYSVIQTWLVMPSTSTRSWTERTKHLLVFYCTVVQFPEFKGREEKINRQYEDFKDSKLYECMESCLESDSIPTLSDDDLKEFSVRGFVFTLTRSWRERMWTSPIPSPSLSWIAETTNWLWTLSPFTCSFLENVFTLVNKFPRQRVAIFSTIVRWTCCGVVSPVSCWWVWKTEWPL